MIRRPPRSTLSSSSAASDVYKRQLRGIGLISDVGPLVVDCEYNRHGGAYKALAVEEKLKSIVMAVRKRLLDDPDEDGFYDFSVAPDIVVHQRTTDVNNLL